MIIQEGSIRNAVIRVPDWPAIAPNAFPGSFIPLIVQSDGGLHVQEMTWGYPVEWSRQPVFNTRCEKAVSDEGSHMWRSSLEERRCIIPSYGFFEPHRSEKTISLKTNKEVKQKYFFKMADEPLTFLAGIYENGHCSVMTTEPNATMLPIHDRMPVVLRQGEVEKWLSGNYEALFDRSDVNLYATRVESPQQRLF